MNISDFDDSSVLDKRVTFQKFVGEADIVGDFQYQDDANWEDVVTVWAEIRTISSRADTELLLVCLQGALLAAAQHMPTPKTLDALVTAVTGRALSKQSLRKWSEQWALALLETLAGGIVDDYSAPADLNVTLRWEPQANTVTVHPLLRLIRLLTEFFTRRFR